MPHITDLISLPEPTYPAETVQHLLDAHGSDEATPAEHVVAVHLFSHGGGGRPDLADTGLTHTHHAPAGPATAPAPTGTNGLAIAALVLGIIGIAAGTIPLFFFVAGTCGLLGVIFGCVGRKKAKAGAPYMKMAGWGLATGVIAMGLSFAGAVTVFSAVDQFGQDMENIGAGLESHRDCLARHDPSNWDLFCD